MLDKLSDEKLLVDEKIAIDTPIVVIGAGPAGLTAAYECTLRNKKPIILDQGDTVGGMARTESYNGYHFDIGGHRFFTKNETIRQLWENIMGEDFLKVQRLSRIYYKDRFFSYPLSIMNALSNLGVIESFLIFLSYISAQIKTGAKDETFEQWITNRFGRRLFETFFKTYTEKVWGIPCSEIRADWAAQRIKGLSLITAISNALLGVKNAKSLINTFDYPVEGPGMMWQRLVEEIQSLDGQVQLNSKVIRIEHNRRRIQKVFCKNGDKVIEFPAEQLLSSIPINQFVYLLSPDAPHEIFNAAQKLKHRSFIIVGLIINKADLFPDQWIYIHSPDVHVGRIQNFKNWSAAMVPEPHTTSIGMEYFCDKDDDLWKLTDRELADIAMSELSFLGLADSKDVMDFYVVRQPYAYPIYDEIYQENLGIIRKYLNSFENLQTMGRNGMHRYNNMDHSMLTGMLAAKNVFGAAHNLWEVNEEEAYLEEDIKDREVTLPLSEELVGRIFARMDKLAFGVSVGTVTGLMFFVSTLWLILKGGTVIGPNLMLLAQYFKGFTVTISGAFIAMAYGFCWGMLLGWLTAYLRNLFLALYLLHIKMKSGLRSMREFLECI